jgi:hypothetical protein
LERAAQCPAHGRAAGRWLRALLRVAKVVVAEVGAAGAEGAAFAGWAESTSRAGGAAAPAAALTTGLAAAAGLPPSFGSGGGDRRDRRAFGRGFLRTFHLLQRLPRIGSHLRVRGWGSQRHTSEGRSRENRRGKEVGSECIHNRGERVVLKAWTSVSRRPSNVHRCLPGRA